MQQACQVGDRLGKGLADLEAMDVSELALWAAFYEKHDPYQLLFKMLNRRFAELRATVMNASGRWEPVTADELLPPEPGETVYLGTEEDFQKLRMARANVVMEEKTEGSTQKAE